MKKKNPPKPPKDKGVETIEKITRHIFEQSAVICNTVKQDIQHSIDKR